MHYRRFDFPSPPSRKTLRRRFLALPTFLQSFMPELASEAGDLDERFSFRTVFADKGLKKVEAYLLLLTASLQVLMIFNSIYQHPLQATKPFRFALDECPPLT